MTEEDWLSQLDRASIKFEADRIRWLIIYQKLYAANVQLSQAIDLFLHSKNFICAITLSGAANGLLREMLKTEFDSDPLGRSAKLVMLLAEASPELEKIKERDVIRGELHPVNWLKHYLSFETKTPELRFFDDEESAYNTIENSLYSYSIFIKIFAATLSIELREKLFGSPQITIWREYWGDDDGSFFNM